MPSTVRNHGQSRLRLFPRGNGLVLMQPVGTVSLSLILVSVHPGNLRVRVQAMSRAIGRTNGKRVPRRAYVFEAAVCDGCPLRPQCVNRTRIVSLHP